MSNAETTRKTVNVGRLTITSTGRAAGQTCINKAHDALCFARAR